MSKNQQLIKKELEKLGHTGVEVVWHHLAYFYRSDQTKNAYENDIKNSWVLLGVSIEATMAEIEKEKYWLGGGENEAL